MADREPILAGVDIGGTSIGALLTTSTGGVIASASVPTPRGGAAMAATAIDLVQHLMSAHGVSRLRAVGAGAAGVISSQGRIEAASDSFTDWVGFELGEALQTGVNAPAVVMNDVNAFLQGEVDWGAVAGATFALGVMLGTGVGGAIIVDGELYGGATGAAGEIGHIPGYSHLMCTCGRTGHLETLASGKSIERRYHHAAGVARTGAEIAQAARNGDEIARSLYAEAAEGVALAIISTATLFDLDNVVIGGGVTQAWDLLWEPMSAVFADNPPLSGPPLRVHRTSAGPFAVARGAAAVAHNTVALATV